MTLFKATIVATTVCLVGASLVTGCGGSQPSVRPRAVEQDAEPQEDMGKQPWVVDIEEITIANPYFRTARWTGTHLQMTLMTLPPGGEIGLEAHPNNDQFLRIEQGQGRVVMGPTKDKLTVEEEVEDDWAIFIPAGYWHNLTNTGEVDLKLYSIYGPTEHPAGTFHETAEDDDHEHDHDDDHDHHHDHGHDDDDDDQ